MFKKLFSIEVTVWDDAEKVHITSMLSNFKVKFEVNGLENRMTDFFAKVTETQLDEIVSYTSPADRHCSVKILLNGGITRLYVSK